MKNLFGLFLGAVQLIVANAASASSSQPQYNNLLAASVVAVRTVPAYAHALGASPTFMGKVGCDYNGSGNVPFTKTSIFRVEAKGKYFDLSKVCTNDVGGFDYPKGAQQSGDWKYWQNLHVGERVVMKLKKRKQKLSVDRCKSLGYLSASQVSLIENSMMDPSLDAKANSLLASHCAYWVHEVHVRVARGQYHNIWTFRLVDSGSVSQGNGKPIGSGYSKRLRPWD